MRTMRTETEIEEAIATLSYDMAQVTKSNQKMFRYKIESLKWVLEQEELF